MSAVAPATPADVAAVTIGLLNSVSIEIAAGRPKAIDSLRGAFDPGVDVYVNYLPGGDWRAVLETAAALRRAGFNPVPHIAVRSLASRAALDGFVAGLAREAGAARVLLIAGDRDPPHGPFAAAADVLRTGVLSDYGIRSVGFAGHPEGHPTVAPAVMAAALAEKVGLAAGQGLSPFIVTQFGFEAAPILAWIDALRAGGVAAPVRVGVAGPATMATLLRFAMSCGVGNSLRALRQRPNAVGRLLGVSGPEELVRDLAAGLTARPGHGVAGLHIFPFGGVERAGAWVAETLARLYAGVKP